MSRTETHKPSASAALLLVVITILAYLSALRGGFVWDDAEYVTENPALQVPGGLWGIWFDPSAHNTEAHYWPVTYTSFWVEYQLWGARPVGYHLTNVLLHVLNSILLWLLLRRLAIPGAVLAAVIFALHPVHVESVAWIIERKDVLSGLFYILAFWAYVRFLTTRAWSIYALAAVLFICAMLSKSVAVTLPVALGLWCMRDRVRRAEVLPLIPLIALAAGLTLLDLWRVAQSAPPYGPDLPLLDRPLIAGRAFWFYLGKLLWPAELMATYPRWEIEPGSFWQWLYPLAALALVASLWALRRKLGKGPLLAVLFFAVTLGPVLGLVQFGFMRVSFVADRFQYLASIGIIVLVAAASARGVGRLRLPARWTALAAAGLLLVLGGLTWRYAGVYRDDETFWRYNVRKNPESYAAHYNLGVVLGDAGETPEAALFHLRRALEIYPDFAEAQNRLGMELARRKQHDVAVWHFREAVQIDPDFADAWHNLGFALAQQGQLEPALECYLEALSIRPDFSKAHYHLAVALAKLGRLEPAIQHFRNALQLDPDEVDARYDYAVALVQQNRIEEAIAQLDEVLRLAPGDAQARTLRDQLRSSIPRP